MAFATIPAWSTTAGTNTEIDGISLAENVMVPSAVNNAFREMMSQVAEFTRRGSDLPSAATLDLDSIDTMFLDITGTTTVTAVTLTDGHSRRARATGAFQFTASATLVVNGSTSTNYTTTAGDLLFFEGYSASTVRVWAMSGGAGATFATNAQAVTGTSTVLATNPANLLATRQLIGATFNLGLAASVGSSALTIALKGADGNDPSASNPVEILFRNVTSATGTPTRLSITAATTLVINSTATMGFSNGTSGRLWVVLFNDGGTARIGAINCWNGADVYPLGAKGIASSTTVGTGADSAHVFYSDSGVTSKAYAVLGYMEWSAGLAAAGTWDIVPTRIQLLDADTPLPGHVVQFTRTQTGAVATGTTTVPVDDTIPQNTEGDQYLAAPAITATSACNVRRSEAVVNSGHAVNTAFLVASLFKDSDAGALATTITVNNGTNGVGAAMSINHAALFGAVAAQTMKVRVGSASGGTTTFNGQNSARLFGGVMLSSLQVTEIMA